MVVVDGVMAKYHGEGIRHYVLTLMHIVSIAITLDSHCYYVLDTRGIICQDFNPIEPGVKLKAKSLPLSSK